MQPHDATRMIRPARYNRHKSRARPCKSDATARAPDRAGHHSRLHEVASLVCPVGVDAQPRSWIASLAPRAVTGRWAPREQVPTETRGTRGMPDVARLLVARLHSPGQKRAYLRWRIFERIRRFLRPSFRRPLPVFFVPTQYSVEKLDASRRAVPFEGPQRTSKSRAPLVWGPPWR